MMNAPFGVVIVVALPPGHWLTTVADALGEGDELVKDSEVVD
jgi:hypothetical protein